jgi:hypothetical protein
MDAVPLTDAGLCCRHRLSSLIFAGFRCAVAWTEPKATGPQGRGGHFAGRMQDIGPWRTVRAVTSIVLEEMMAMQTLILLFVVLVTACMCAAWSTFGERPDGVLQARNRSEPPATNRSRPDTLEGVVVDQLIDGLITPRQYLRAMEHLAARDDKRHPLAVPPEIGSADA